MSETIVDTWQEISAWLEQKAPATYSSIVAPVSSERRSGVAELLGYPLPDELATWWALHDGCPATMPGSLFPGDFNPYGIETMLTIRSRWLAICRRFDVEAGYQSGAELPAGDHAWSFLPSFVPVAGNGSGDELVVDLRDGDARGCVKKYFHEDGALYPPVATSLATMLFDLLGSLRDGRPAGDWRPEVFVGYLTWKLSAW